MLEVIKKRRSIRKYMRREVEDYKLKEILKAAMCSPSAMHRKPWEFIVVKDQEIKNKLSKASPWSDFVKDAPIILIIAAKQEIPSHWWMEDCSIVAEAIYLEATNQDLGTCFCQIVGAKSILSKDSEEYVKELIQAPKDLRILCLMPIGYPDEEKSKHSEEEFDENKIHYEKY